MTFRQQCLHNAIVLAAQEHIPGATNIKVTADLFEFDKDGYRWSYLTPDNLKRRF
jgi:hypothetical protein